jgi:phosphoribosyl 1,2-cyclic phosphodiesterase
MSYSNPNFSAKSSSFYFRFWGVRGSIASPGPDTQKYGGNTACVEVRAGDQIIIMDGGTGLRRLGSMLMEEPNPKVLHIFLSHLHWDHIQGIPFFLPAFIKGNQVTFYGERKQTQSLKDILEAQMHSPNFPVPLSVMQAHIEFVEIKADQTFTFDDEVVVKTGQMNHPNGCLGIRVDYQGKSVVYATDTEHDPKGPLDSNVLKLTDQVDALIYDSMYTEEEYHAGKIGWGHSTYTQAIRIARKAQVKNVYFFHHDPENNDLLLDARLKEMKDKTAQDSFCVEMAIEGHTHFLIEP